MHIHPNNNLQLASLGASREELQELQAKRATEVRRKLSSASRIIEDSEDSFTSAQRVERRSYGEGGGSESRHTDDDSFGKLFSAKA